MVYICWHIHAYHDKNRNEEEKRSGRRKTTRTRYPNGILPGSARIKTCQEKREVYRVRFVSAYHEIIQTRSSLLLLSSIRGNEWVSCLPLSIRFHFQRQIFHALCDMESRFARRKMYGAARFQVNANFPWLRRVRDCGDVSFEPRYDERFVLTTSFCPLQPAEEGTLAIELAEKAGGKRRTRRREKKMTDPGKWVVRGEKNSFAMEWGNCKEEGSMVSLGCHHRLVHVRRIANGTTWFEDVV